MDDKHQEYSADLDLQEDNNNENFDNNREPKVDTGNSLQTSTPADTGKRKVGSSILPRLIDNNRKHLKRNLLAEQRDQLFMKKMKNDADFRKDCFSKSVEEISKSKSDLSKGSCASVELLSRTIGSQPQPQFPPFLCKCTL